jgi:hypothetical protein
MSQSCGNCPTPTGEGQFLCHRCCEALEWDLAEVDSTVDALWASAARRDVGSGSVGSSGHKSPTEPANSRAYDTGRTLNTILTGWATALGYPARDAVKASTVLLARIREVREQDWAPVLKQELSEALADCRRAMDRAANRAFAGMCPTTENGQECGTPVYAPQGKPEARCPTCGATWDVTDWRERALEAAGMHTGTPAEVSRMLSDPVTGEALPQGRIRQWINRGTLTPIGDRNGRPVYQVRKVRNLWDRMTAKAATRAG